MKEENIQDGWEDCMAVSRKLFHEQLDIEEKSQQQWGHQSTLSIESFRRIVDKILTPKHNN